MFLTGITRREGAASTDTYPWTVPAIHDLAELHLTTPVTFLIGENGSGKSTVMELIAAGMDVAAIATREVWRDETLAAARDLAKGFRFQRRRHPRTRLFMRAEDVFGFVGGLVRQHSEVPEILKQARAAEGQKQKDLYDEFLNRAEAYGGFTGNYGMKPDQASHGETFLALLGKRVVPGGLYLLDEPETPLSPTRVLALMVLIRDAVKQGSQFIIATHSPMLMALPGASILAFEGGAIRAVAWEETEHVRVTRGFLNDPRRYLDQL